MTTRRTSRAALLLACTVALGACDSSTNGGGGGGGGGGSSSETPFQENFDQVTGTAPTSNMPTSINATYAGAVQASVNDGVEELGILDGDVTLDVAWTDGQSTNPFSGQIDNLRFTDSDGTVALQGELVTDNDVGSISRTEVSALGQTAFTGSMTVLMRGNVSVQDGGETLSGDADIQLGGPFFGSGASGSAGAASGGLRLDEGTSGAIADYAIAGEYYLRRQ
ncbi:hypothetical protein HMH01_16325 [Halovulum dunhuangense]|uniref:Transferrin-binding protein B C-lobe/N-lobe beta barrel domain-containing protein n=1 Tax=Halovulum dunhuangense TaxID=1505036 RepID=A0A849L6D5_9RHOB|nr:hypothetical protein [Halovulum dunhuangense]NNU82005.1 hypothetical protein [Halovulum dunhuangense]